MQSDVVVAMQCRACGPCARGQCQGDAVPAGRAACRPQHQVPADPQGLQGMLWATALPVMLAKLRTVVAFDISANVGMAVGDRSA
jgi:hypothetical protein